MTKYLALVVLIALALPAATLAAEVEVYADVLSAYVYEGLVGNDEPVFQPGLDITAPYGFALSFWGSMNLTDVESPWYPDSAGEWGELNLGLSWTLPWEGPVRLTLGALYYAYPQESSEILFDDETGDMVLDEDGFAQVSRAPADGGYDLIIEVAADEILLSPSVQFVHTAEGSDDWRLLFSIGHSLDLMDALSLDLGATAGYAGKGLVEAVYLSDTGAAFTFAQIDASLNYAVTSALSVGLKGAFSTLIDSDIRDAIKASGDYPKSDIFFGGLTASYTF